MRYFVAAAEELNFTRAAERLHIATPALSVQIRKLETEIGTDLFVREGRGIKLTEAGRVFLEQARRTLADANRSLALARQAANGEIGNLSIGHNGPAEILMFPQIVPAFKKQYPNVHFTFHNHRTPRQVEMLRREEIDVGFVWQPIPTDGFDVCELMKIPLVAVLPEDHRLALAPKISIKDLSQEPLVLFSQLQDHESFYQIEQLFLHAGTMLSVAYESENLLSIINFVSMGIGCSLLPDYTHSILNRVVYKPLQPPNIVKALAIIKNKRSSGLTEQFFQFVVDKFSVTTHIAAN
ncbi:MAG: LysR family transcriptional regulator [Alphaproteobacteria bacterium]|nr:LysR family transcriptional regulator [Alphaproteobacteria bacterium]